MVTNWMILLAATNLFTWQESNVEIFIHLHVVDAAADSGNHDDLPLLSLKLLHRAHLEWLKKKVKPV